MAVVERYDVLNASWRTPKGNTALMAYRYDTNDWNTIQSAMPEDEYGLRGRNLTGIALDIGCHVGSVSVALLMDNPELRVIAVEPLPENIALIRRNADINGVLDRLTLHEGAVGTSLVRYAYDGDERSLHHAYVGNAYWAAGVGNGEHRETTVPMFRIRDLLGDWQAGFTKIDCEGGEWSFLDDPAVVQLSSIVGEWHPIDGHAQGDIVDLLGATHRVAFNGPTEGPGGFLADLR